MPAFSRFGAIAAITFASTAALVTPAQLTARDSGVYYTAKLAAPAAQSRFTANGREWLCDGTNCIAQRSSERPLRVCRDLAREVGAVTEFTAGGEAIDAGKLVRCNS